MDYPREELTPALCLRWLHSNGWEPGHPCACGKPDYPSQILGHCQGCAEILDCDEARDRYWCGPCHDRHRLEVAGQSSAAWKACAKKWRRVAKRLDTETMAMLAEQWADIIAASLPTFAEPTDCEIARQAVREYVALILADPGKPNGYATR